MHANSAHDALRALVNAAIMAGENVSESIVRTVFASTIDLVVHLDMDDPAPLDLGAGLRREVTEVIAVVPALHDDFSTEPLFRREAIGEPLMWTGAMPPHAAVLERGLPDGLTLRAVLEGRSLP